MKPTDAWESDWYFHSIVYVRHQEGHAKIDAILDKIAKSGYDSLTAKEKEYLFKHSKKM